MVQVKICGVQDLETLSVVMTCKADYVGFVFYPPSPRHVSLEKAIALAAEMEGATKSVLLLARPQGEDLRKIKRAVDKGGFPFDYVQMHGGESPDEIRQIKGVVRVPIIKAFHVHTEKDLDAVEDYTDADMFLFDAKPSDPDAMGGTGQSFDWSVLKGRTFSRPWMLSGGLNAENIDGALQSLEPDAVDVSSGVERGRGIKDAARIKEFIEAVRATEE